MLLVITHPETLPGETLIWQQLLTAGADALLLRKPGWLPDDYAAALEQIDAAFRPRILIAAYWELQEHYGLLGVHLGEGLRNSTSAALLAEKRRQGCLLSTGMHDPAALPAAMEQWDLLLLSPVFDSISKAGYKSRFPPGFRLQRGKGQSRILALGGVDAGNAAQAQEMGFDGIALLGAIWEKPGEAVENLSLIKNIWNANAHT
jgi:thiamine-phosphate pyrophosphorylase